MTVSNLKYSTTTALTIALASLATSATFVAGRESTEVNNNAANTQFIDVSLEGFVTVGTTPTIDTAIRIYVWGSHTSLATVAKDTLDGLDSIETLSSSGIRDGILKRAATLNVDSTVSDRKYHFGPISIAQLFGDMPEFWGVFVTHNTGVNLNATAANHEIKFTPLEFESV